MSTTPGAHQAAMSEKLVVIGDRLRVSSPLTWEKVIWAYLAHQLGFDPSSITNENICRVMMARWLAVEESGLQGKVDEGIRQAFNERGLREDQTPLWTLSSVDTLVGVDLSANEITASGDVCFALRHVEDEAKEWLEIVLRE